MGAIYGTATRALASGYSLNDPIELDTTWQQVDRQTKKIGSKVIALSGQYEAELDRFERRLLLQTDLIAPANRDVWDMLFESHGNEEQLQVDLTGTVASPGTLYSGHIEGYPTERRNGQIWLQFSFTFLRA